jgi:hypothetical protein
VESARPEDTEAQTVAGEITAWDAAQKQFELTTEEGKELRLQWNEKTRVEGEPQVGAAVEVTFHMSEGTLVATHIRVL